MNRRRLIGIVMLAGPFVALMVYGIVTGTTTDRLAVGITACMLAGGYLFLSGQMKR